MNDPGRDLAAEALIDEPAECHAEVVDGPNHPVAFAIAVSVRHGVATAVVMMHSPSHSGVPIQALASSMFAFAAVTNDNVAR